MSGNPAMLTLVTGATGLVGNNLIRHLLQLGRPVRALMFDDDESLRGLDIERVAGDVRDPADLKRAIEGVDIVYHLAAAISIDDDHRRTHIDSINIEGTANVVRACLDAGVKRLIHFSSIHALSYFPKDDAIDESRALALDQARHLRYDHTKAVAETKVLEGVERGLDAVILNPVGIFGPNDFVPSTGGELLLQLARRELPGLVRSGFYWVDARDVVHAALAAEERGRRGHRYILAGEYATFEQIAKWVQQATGARPPLLNIPIWMAKAAVPLVVRLSRLNGHRPLFTSESVQIITCHQKITTTKAAEELGFRPRPVRESVLDSINWLQGHFGSSTDAAAGKG
ncbi:MAG: NAD-dependent epimerase/dehydratase family protein [Pirellulales bacterium]|nr:NAD-dependent epimerase/dehydratase family protein [Pirellulales bacterium]